MAVAHHHHQQRQAFSVPARTPHSFPAGTAAWGRMAMLWAGFGTSFAPISDQGGLCVVVMIGDDCPGAVLSS